MMYALHRSSAYFPSVTGARSVISTGRKAQDARCNMCTVGDLSCRHRYTVEECVEREVRSRIAVHAGRCAAERLTGTSRVARGFESQSRHRPVQGMSQLDRPWPATGAVPGMTLGGIDGD